MKPVKIVFFLILFCSIVYGQKTQTDVLTLGVFHFSFPNLDVIKIDEKDQIDVFETEYQKEIEILVEKLSAFKPDIIAIERQPGRQQMIDSLYSGYLNNNHELSRHEEQQIGFRLAKRLGIEKLYCVDEWGCFTEDIKQIMEDPEKQDQRDNFANYFYSNPDSNVFFNKENIFKTQGIIAQLRMLNDRETISQCMGNYLIGPFKYEIEENDFLGVHFRTGNWFSRNLKIFRNIQRIKTGENSRILVIFGADHMNLLNFFFESSPEYHLVETNTYLQ